MVVSIVMLVFGDVYAIISSPWFTNFPPVVDRSFILRDRLLFFQICGPGRFSRSGNWDCFEGNVFKETTWKKRVLQRILMRPAYAKSHHKCTRQWCPPCLGEIPWGNFRWQLYNLRTVFATDTEEWQVTNTKNPKAKMYDVFGCS